MLAKKIVHRPVSILILTATIIGLSLFSSSGLPIDLFPQIDVPIAVISTSYGDTLPEEVETQVTRLIEGAMGSVGDVEKITSRSGKGFSQVTLEFVGDVNLDQAMLEIRDAIETIKPFLPDGADTPRIFRFNPDSIPILTLILLGNRSMHELRDLAEDLVQPRIERISGVALTSLTGGSQRYIRVAVPSNRLEAYNLSLSEIANAIRGQNIEISAGSIVENQQNLLINTNGRYEDLEQVRDTVISYRTGPGQLYGSDISTHVVRLRDIANVDEAYDEDSGYVTSDGVPAVSISVQKQTGTNSVAVADEVIKRLDEINRYLPAGVRIEPFSDTTVFIRGSLNQVVSSAVTGAVLAILVIFFFLRNWNSTLIIAVAIPIAFVITLMSVYFAGLTLNIMTLSGLALGIGMLVDNSIVILENIYRYREKGNKLIPSAILGTQEMLGPIASSTFTTVSVFMPLILFRRELGIIGQIFESLAFTVVISLLSSLFVAVFLVPILSSYLFPLYTTKQRPLVGRKKYWFEIIDRFLHAIEASYRKSITYVFSTGRVFKIFSKKWLIVIVTLTSFVSSFFLIPLIGFTVFPGGGDDTVVLNVRLDVGTNIEETKAVMTQISDLIKRDLSEHYQSMVVTAGVSTSPFGGSGQDFRGSIFLKLLPFSQRTLFYNDMTERLRGYESAFSGMRFSFGQGRGGGISSDPISIKLLSDDLSESRDYGNRIIEALKKYVPEATELSLDEEDALPQLDIVVDRDRAYDLGLNLSAVGQEIKASVDGLTVSQFVDGAKEYDIILSLDENDKKQIVDIGRLAVSSNRGERITLDSVASLRTVGGATVVRRENQTRLVQLKGQFVDGTNLSDATAKVESVIAQYVPPSDSVILDFSGENEEVKELIWDFMMILLISVFLVFGIMAAQFESFMDPFIILFTIPMTFTGIFLVHFLSRDILSVITGVGLVMLSGIVVNNGIVLVDYMKLLRARGYAVREAIIEASISRLRPVLMTTLTTVMGLLPMVFTRGESDGLIRPIGLTVLGGMTVASVFTLFLVPVLYWGFHETLRRSFLLRFLRGIPGFFARLLRFGKKNLPSA